MPGRPERPEMPHALLLRSQVVSRQPAAGAPAQLQVAQAAEERERAKMEHFEKRQEMQRRSARHRWVSIGGTREMEYEPQGLAPTPAVGGLV